MIQKLSIFLTLGVLILGLMNKKRPPEGGLFRDLRSNLRSAFYCLGVPQANASVYRSTVWDGFISQLRI